MQTCLDERCVLPLLIATLDCVYCDVLGTWAGASGKCIISLSFFAVLRQPGRAFQKTSLCLVFAPLSALKSPLDCVKHGRHHDTTSSLFVLHFQLAIKSGSSNSCPLRLTNPMIGKLMLKITLVKALGLLQYKAMDIKQIPMGTRIGPTPATTLPNSLVTQCYTHYFHVPATVSTDTEISACHKLAHYDLLATLHFAKKNASSAPSHCDKCCHCDSRYAHKRHSPPCPAAVLLGHSRHAADFFKINLCVPFLPHARQVPRPNHCHHSRCPVAGVRQGPNQAPVKSNKLEARRTH